MTNTTSCFTALADPTRRGIFERVSRRPSAVRELAALFPVSRPAVSQHLKILKDAGLVQVETRGTRHIYRINLNGIAVMRRYFDRFWDGALEDFKQHVEQSETKP